MPKLIFKKSAKKLELILTKFILVTDINKKAISKSYN